MLPYPDMDFVPFDILTAEELDKLVSNIEAVSNGTGLQAGSVTTSTLAESAVTSSKLALSKTVDANGWTVYDYGSWKLFCQQFNYDGSDVVGSGQTRSLMNVTNLPVGVANMDSVHVSLGLRINDGAFSLYLPTSNTSTTLQAHIRNNHTGNATRTFSRLTITLVTK